MAEESQGFWFGLSLLQQQTLQPEDQSQLRIKFWSIQKFTKEYL